MLDLEWVLNALKEARDDEDWDLVKEVKLKNKRDLKQEDYSNEVENKLEEVLKDLTSQFEA